MTENDVNPPINNDPMEKRNEFIDPPSYMYMYVVVSVLRAVSHGYGTVRTKASSFWDDSHKRIFFTGTIHPGRFAQMVKKWNKKFLIENFKLQYIVNILIFIALWQIKFVSIFQIRKLFCLIFFKIYWGDSPKFPNFQKSGRTSFKMIVDG